MYIRIISSPPGDAPENVRADWVGLVLPLAVPRVHDVDTVGVLSRPKRGFGSFFAHLAGRTKKEQGYTVEAARSIEILATHSRLGSKLVAEKCSMDDPTWNIFIVPNGKLSAGRAMNVSTHCCISNHRFDRSQLRYFLKSQHR
jgi:hypothetical protein